MAHTWPNIVKSVLPLLYHQFEKGVNGWNDLWTAVEYFFLIVSGIICTSHLSGTLTHCCLPFCTSLRKRLLKREETTASWESRSNQSNLFGASCSVKTIIVQLTTAKPDACLSRFCLSDALLECCFNTFSWLDDHFHHSLQMCTDVSLININHKLSYKCKD